MCTCCGPVTCRLFVTEVVRFCAILVPLSLAIWRAADLIKQSAIAYVLTLVLGVVIILTYMITKIICCGQKFLRNAREERGWRPSILTYIILCGLPSSVLMAVALAANNQDSAANGIDPISLMVIQFMVAGLTITEWCAKARERDLSPDMLTAVATDLFYAYDVYEFFEMQLHESKTWASDTWVYVVFFFGFVSMLKYIPNMPSRCNSSGSSVGQAKAAIWTGMIFQDLPFFVIRVIILIKHGFSAADFFYPAKNLVHVFINIWQLCMIGTGTGAYDRGTFEPTV